jgi:chromate transporter
MQIAQYEAPPTLWRLFCLWCSIGLQSFGGGASTVFLIQRVFTERHRWLTSEEFAENWSLSQFTPGINLLATTVLIGRKLGGTVGIAVSLAGLLIPSATITCLLAVGFEQIQHFPATNAVLRGVVPATAGVMLVVGLNFALPILKRAYKVGLFSLVLNGALMILAAVSILWLRLIVPIVIIGFALLGVVLFTPWRAAPTPMQKSEIEADASIPISDSQEQGE